MLDSTKVLQQILQSLNYQRFSFGFLLSVNCNGNKHMWFDVTVLNNLSTSQRAIKERLGQERDQDALG